MPTIHRAQAHAQLTPTSVVQVMNLSGLSLAWRFGEGFSGLCDVRAASVAGFCCYDRAGKTFDWQAASLVQKYIEQM